MRTEERATKRRATRVRARPGSSRIPGSLSDLSGPGDPLYRNSENPYNDIVWADSKCLPSSVRDRLTVSHGDGLPARGQPPLILRPGRDSRAARPVDAQAQCSTPSSARERPEWSHASMADSSSASSSHRSTPTWPGRDCSTAGSERAVCARLCWGLCRRPDDGAAAPPGPSLPAQRSRRTPA